MYTKSLFTLPSLQHLKTFLNDFTCLVNFPYMQEVQEAHTRSLVTLTESSVLGTPYIDVQVID